MPRAFFPPSCSVARKTKQEERDHDAGNDVQDHHFAPGEHREQRPHDDGRDRVADVPPIPCSESHEALPLGEKTVRERGNRRRSHRLLPNPTSATQPRSIR